ncbi:MAG: peptidoglycan-binding domain-containing protein, partial [Bacteroidota bacterium]
KSLGYRDAFIKQVDPARLITIGTFETGIKKPLIPINLQDSPPTTTTPAQDPAPQAVNTPLSPAPGTYESSPAPATAPPTTTTPNLAPNSLNAVTTGPTIDGRTKRSSAAELQRVLKEKGYYESTIDGYYGPGTTAAYETAWAGMPEISKYKMLANTLPLEYVGANWEETMVLVAIAEELSAGTANVSRAEQMLSQRPSLYAAGQPLTSPAATRVRNWAATIWTNLDEWAIEDPLHAQIFSAFRIAYHQTQVRLEDHYMQRGLKADDARDLATAMLQNLLGARLDRFL